MYAHLTATPSKKSKNHRNNKNHTGTGRYYNALLKKWDFLTNPMRPFIVLFCILKNRNPKSTHTTHNTTT